MQIQMEPHTLERALERGANEEEIIETLRRVRPVVAKSGRFGKVKAFQFNDVWKGKHYDQKEITVYYLVEEESIITITVYVYYGKFDI